MTAEIGAGEVCKYSVDSSYFNFINRKESGAFFIHKYMGHTASNQAFVLTNDHGEITNTNLVTKKEFH